MKTKQRPSLLILILKAPFFVGFLVILYFLGRSCIKQINGFGLALGFPAAAIRLSTYSLGFLFIFITILVLIRYLSGDD